MPVSLVKLSAVSRCRSTICWLLTMSTLMLLGPPSPPPPPHPAQAVLVSRTRASSNARNPDRVPDRNTASSQDPRALRSDERGPAHHERVWHRSRIVNG